jgi:dipeptidyl-peptidase-3
MKFTVKIMIGLIGLGVLSSCSSKKSENFKYSVDEFADIEVLRYKVPGWEALTLQQKEYVYDLSEAAKWGRDIFWDQNCAYNLKIRKILETILENYDGDEKCEDYQKFLVYAKRVFFSSGIHHHYGEQKFIPACGSDYFSSLMTAVGCSDSLERELIPVIFDPDVLPFKRYQGTDKDIVKASAVNFYEGVTQKEAERFYADMEDRNDPRPVSYGLNSKLVKRKGKIYEEIYSEDGLYGPAISKIIEYLQKASSVAENDIQRDIIAKLIDYYRTGDLRKWDEYNIAWVRDTASVVDFVNGFVEDYEDPLNRKASWEAIVDFKDLAASERTEIISSNAQWFENNSPVDPRFRKAHVKGVSAKVINVVVLAGDEYPPTAIGINLPNADWIRKDYGSKSVTIANITEAYDLASEEHPKSVLKEFSWDEKEEDICRKYGTITDNLHTDLHECLGHGSGQLLPGVSPNALREYGSTLEEARADLFALYYLADPKLVEIGLLENGDEYKAEYMNYIRNGIMTQLSRIKLGDKITEAHMQNRALIANWCFEHGKENNVIERKMRGGKTYFVINDFKALRGLFGDLLAEIQRIKSEGDYEAGKALVLKYGVDIDYNLHKEVLERYDALGLKPYKGFVNPDIVPVRNAEGDIMDYRLEYCDDFVKQSLEYGREYSAL